MEFLKSVVSTIVGNGPPFLFVLIVVVFFHELGHFLIARLCGVGVKVFSIGLGPELFGWHDRWGTRWRISAIPLGGYVKFVGDDSIASTPDAAELEAMDPQERDLAFQTKSVGRRAAIVAAGPIANFVLAILIFSVLFLVSGRIDTSATVGAVVPGSAAEAANLRAGDVIVAIEGQPVESFVDIMRGVSGRGGVPTALAYERDGVRHAITITPRQQTVDLRGGGTESRGFLGIQRNMVSLSPIEAVGAGVSETWVVISGTGTYLGRLFTGRESLDQLGGPIRVAEISGKVAEVGFGALVNLVAILSVSIGLFNLLPVPLLDGGHLVFYAVEAIRGRPLSERAQDIGFRIGLALVLALMVVTTWNDIARHTSM
jgi:regulator of sigma E protease